MLPYAGYASFAHFYEGQVIRRPSYEPLEARISTGRDSVAKPKLIGRANGTFPSPSLFLASQSHSPATHTLYPTDGDGDAKLESHDQITPHLLPLSLAALF